MEKNSGHKLQIFQILVYFICKICNPHWKKSPPLSQEPPSKNWVSVKPPLFENLVVGSTPHHPHLAERGGGARCVFLKSFCKKACLCRRYVVNDFWWNYHLNLEWFFDLHLELLCRHLLVPMRFQFQFWWKCVIPLIY